MEVGGPWAPFSRSALERPFFAFTASVALLYGARTAQMWLLSRSPVISVQFLQICILRRSRDISAQCQPTDSLAAHLAGPQSCAPNYAAGPQLPAQLRGRPTVAPPNCTAGHKPSPTRHQTMANPPQPAPNLPKRFPNFTSHANILKFTNLLLSPPLSRRSCEYPSKRFVAGPKCPPTRIATFISAPSIPHPICSSLRVSPHSHCRHFLAPHPICSSL